MTFNKNFQKPILFFLLGILVLESILVFPKKSQALLPGESVAIITAIGASTTAITGAIAAAQVAQSASDSILMGVPGTGTLPFVTQKTALEACIKVINGLEKAFLDTPIKMSSLATLGVSPAESASLGTKIAALKVAEKCYSTAIKSVIEIPAASMLIAQEKTAIVNDWTTQLNRVKGRIEDLNSRLSMSVKSVLQAVAVQILLGVGKTITYNLVSGMLDKYPIQDYMARTASLEQNFYTTKYILSNYKNSDDQQIVRALLLSGKNTYDVAAPLVNKKAASNLGFDPASIDLNNPNYESYMAQVGDMASNPITLRLMYETQAAQTKASAQVAAAQQVAAENGFMSSFNCPRSFADQQSIDSQRNNLAKDLRANQLLVLELKSGNASKEDLQKAERALTETENTYNNFKAKNPAVYEVCSAIATPGDWISKTMDNYVQKYFGESASLSKDNLPFAAQLLINVGQQYASSLILGRKVSSKMLLSDGLAAADIALNNYRSSNSLEQIGKDAGVASDSNSPSVTFRVIPGAVNGDLQKFTIEWNASKVSGASSAVLSGPAVQSGGPGPGKIDVSLSGSLTVEIFGGGLYQLDVLDSQKNILSTNVQEAKPSQVQGASVQRKIEPVLLRAGPVKLR